jgi:hypothetical protein
MEPTKDKPALTEGERKLLFIRRRCPSVAADFEKSCAKEATKLSTGLLKGDDPLHVAHEMLTEAIRHLNLKRRAGFYRYGNTGGGDCYEAALLTFAQYTDDDPTLHARLVHGRIIDAKKQSCPHAWVEIGGLCIDPSNHRDRPLILGRKRFYETQGVDEKTVIEYTRAQAIEKNREYVHFGPWDGPDRVPPIV